MKKDEYDYITKQLEYIKMDQVDLDKQSDTIEKLNNWLKDQKPKEKTYPFLHCNWRITNNEISMRKCDRCSKKIYKDDLHFTLDNGPNAIKRYENFCPACANEEEKQHEGYKKYDASKSTSKRSGVLQLIIDKPGITENSIKKLMNIGIDRVKSITNELLLDGTITVKKGPRNSKMHFITTKEKYLN